MFEFLGRGNDVVAHLFHLRLQSAKQTCIRQFVKQFAKSLREEENRHKDNDRQQTHESVAYKKDLELAEGRSEYIEPEIRIEGKG